MEFDYSKLSGRINEKFGTRKAFAEAIGLSENSVSKKLSGKMPITKDNIIEWSKPEILDIDCLDIPVYFFKFKVQDNELCEGESNGAV